MNLLRKIGLSIGVILLFFLLKKEYNDRPTTCIKTQKEASFLAVNTTNLQFIQPDLVSYTLINNTQFFIFFGTLSNIYVLKEHLNSHLHVVSKAFVSRNINRILAVSQLLFPKHNFW
jgi:hypothetical protein